MIRSTLLCLLISLPIVGSSTSSHAAEVTGGETAIELFYPGLASVGLLLESASVETIENTSFFPIVTPPVFEYTVSSLAPFGGAIGHEGTYTFYDANDNFNLLTVGNFVIGYDPGRAVGANSGFYVESTVGVEAILVDLTNVDLLEASSSALLVDADLAVSPELAGLLGDSGLTGANIGRASVIATAIPEPTAALFLCGAGALAGLRRRRR